MHNIANEFSRWLFTIFGGIVAILQPTLPYIIICTLAILYDCYTAWCLAKRVRDAHPDKTSEESRKFNSKHFGHVIVTLLKSYALIILAFLIEQYITTSIPMTKVAAGAICFWQLWSILENESSCNGAKWAKLFQRILVDKTERHFDINLTSLKEDEADS